MGTEVTDVNKMLDELAAQEGTKPATPPADANALLEAATKPPAPAGTQPPATPPAKIDPEKFGQVVNENASLRREMDKMKLDMEAMRQQTRPAESPKPVQAADDGGWAAWSHKQVNETDDATWMANPKEAVRATLERGGRELATHASNIAYSRAWEVGTAMQLDSDFAAMFPDLMGTEMGQVAVRTAINKVQADQRFQTLMRNRTTRPRALAVVAKIANQELGRNEEINPELFGETTAQPRKTVYAERAGARPMGPVGPQITPERQEEAMQSVISHHAAHQ